MIEGFESAAEAGNCAVAANYCAQTKDMVSRHAPTSAAAHAQEWLQYCRERGASTHRRVRHHLRVWAGLVR